jgi:hypothetical protein
MREDQPNPPTRLIYGGANGLLLSEQPFSFTFTLALSQGRRIGSPFNQIPTVKRLNEFLSMFSPTYLFYSQLALSPLFDTAVDNFYSPYSTIY